jgi:hypothetical protein
LLFCGRGSARGRTEAHRTAERAIQPGWMALSNLCNTAGEAGLTT